MYRPLVPSRLLLILAAGLLLLSPHGTPARAKEAPGTAPRRYEASAFFQSTSATGAAFSPDEKTLYLSTDASGVFNTYRVPVGGGSATVLTRSSTDGLFLRASFPRDDRLLLSGDKGGNEITHLFVRELDGTLRELTEGSDVRARFLGWDATGTGLFVSTNERDRQVMDVWRYEAGPAAAPGTSTPRYARNLVATNPGDMEIGAISRDGRWLVLVKANASSDSDLFLWDLKHPAAEPEHITAHEGKVSYGSTTFTPDSRALYYTSDLESEYRRLWSMDLNSKAHVLVAKEEWDIEGVTFSEDGRWRLLQINADAQSVVRLHDRESGKDVELPGVPAGEFRGAIFSPSGRRLAFYVSTDRTPADLYVADLQDSSVRRLTANQNPAIDPTHLVDAQVVRYPSFDDLAIPALLYRPVGASATNKVPALLWVHGGPGGQSRKGYHAMLQYFANHGYAILAVNNRGSSGYGKTFHHLDDRRHGDVDLKDCIWGRRYLESLDWIDGEHIGIMGGSYGGYMTVAALAFAPDAFEIGIDIFGVTNWLRTLKSIPPWWSSFRKALYDEIGDPATDEERLRAISPLFHADKITKPLLVVQGANDPRVLQAESDEIVAAVRAKGVPVEYLLFDDEGHGFRKRENRIRAAEVSVQFADQWLRRKAPRDDPLTAKIDAQVQPYVDAGVFPSLVVGVATSHGRIVRAYGELSTAAGTHPDGDTVYEIGSVSKVFTGIVLAALVEEGVVTLEQEVRSLLPETATLTPIEGVPMTLRHLATHSSGLPRMPANFRPQDPADPYADYAEAQLYAALQDSAHRNKPGAAYAYSNLGVGLLGHLLARRTELSYEELVARYITRPLGMGSTSLALSADQTRRLAPPHDENGSAAHAWNLGLFAGAGGLRSTANDMLLFLEAHLEPDQNPRRESFQVAQAQHSALGPGPVKMGLGWHIAPNGVRVHSGQTGGYHSFLALEPDRFGIVLLANAASAQVDEVGNAIGRILHGLDVAPPTVAAPVRVTPEVLSAYVGRYELQPGFILTITTSGGSLFLQATGQPRLDTRARSPTRFRNDAAQAEIEFEKDEAGTVVRLVLHQHGAQLPAKRLAD